METIAIWWHDISLILKIFVIFGVYFLCYVINYIVLVINGDGTWTGGMDIAFMTFASPITIPLYIIFGGLWLLGKICQKLMIGIVFIGVMIKTLASIDNERDLEEKNA